MYITKLSALRFEQYVLNMSRLHLSNTNEELVVSVPNGLLMPPSIALCYRSIVLIDQTAVWNFANRVEGRPAMWTVTEVAWKATYLPVFSNFTDDAQFVFQNVSGCLLQDPQSVPICPRRAGILARLLHWGCRLVLASR